MGIDRDPEYLFRPWHRDIVTSQTRFDVRDRYTSSKPGERPAQRARCVALHDQHVRGRAQMRLKCTLYDADMGEGVFQPAALQPGDFKTVHVEFSRIKLCVLSREDQPGASAALPESIGHGCKFDCFRPGSDDQPYICGMQPSPYLGGSNLPPLRMKCNMTGRAFLAEVVGVCLDLQFQGSGGH